MNDKVLITGGAGFIGSNYVKYVLNNSEDDIFVLDKLTYAGNMKNLEAVADKITFIEGDICDAELIEKLFTEHQFNKVVHFAAESHVDNSISGPSEFIQTNIVGTFNLVRAAQFVEVIEERQGLKIGAIEEAAYEMGYISKQELVAMAEPLLKSGYGKHLIQLD